MRPYKPRRTGRRWLEGAPEYVLDVFDNQGQSVDRYTVLFGGSELVSDGTFRGTWVYYLSMSDGPGTAQGVSMSGEMMAHEAADYRYRCKRYRTRWLDLPGHVRRHVEAAVRDWNEGPWAESAS